MLRMQRPSFQDLRDRGCMRQRTHMLASARLQGGAAPGVLLRCLLAELHLGVSDEHQGGAALFD